MKVDCMVVTVGKLVIPHLVQSYQHEGIFQLEPHWGPKIQTSLTPVVKLPP